MPLRPRYSLLTLLVLTALVAGGVKLWYGPHHVVERGSPFQEEEYSYTRDWRGNKQQQGPFVLRAFDRAGKFEHVELYFLRNGKNTYYRANDQMAMSYTISKRSSLLPANFYKPSIPDTRLSPAELQTFQQAIESEQSRFRDSNPGTELREGYWPEVFPAQE